MRPRAPLTAMLLGSVCASCTSPDPTLMSGFNTPSVVAPEQVGMSSARLGRLDSFLQGLSERGELGGSVAVIARHGQTAYSKAFGWADVGSGTPMQINTLMRVFSMTKPITCVAALTLVEEGRLLLDDPVSKYLPAFASASVYTGEEDGRIRTVPAERPITIRMLASHTAGIGYGPTPDEGRALAERFEAATLFDPEQTLEAMVDKLADLPLLHQPGTTWQYSASVDVLARVVEVVSGQPFGDFLQDRVFGPLGMRDTGFRVPEEAWDRVATVHTSGEEGQLTRAPQNAILVHDDFKDRRHEAGGHGLVSTAPDYARFARMLLTGGALNGVRILSPKAAELARTDVLQDQHRVVGSSTDPTFNRNALGFGLCGSVIKNPALHSSLGSVGSYSWSGYATTHFFIDPELDLVAVLMSQHDPIDPDQLFERFTNLLYQAILG